MMLIVLEKNPVKAAQKVPDKIKFKQLLELCQMLCSCGYCDIYKKVNQGKAIQEWIKRNITWVKVYAETLLHWCKENINIKYKTVLDMNKIICSLPVVYWYLNPETAVFRYNKNYTNTNYKSDEELKIDDAIEEYKKYMEWKKWNN